VPQFFSARLKDVMQAHDPESQEPEADIRLAPHDVVYVPRNGAAEVHRFLNETFAQLAPVMWGFSYNVGPDARTGAPAR
jgi:hypothetical protein